MPHVDESPLIRALLNPGAYDHPIENIRLFETHISWVILTGPFAYKVKKPVKFEFLDFSTLAKREFYCREELRLNRRLAPQLYLDVVPITGNIAAPRMGDGARAVEYAVKMSQFSQDALLSHAIEQGRLQARHIDTLAEEAAEFHRRIAAAGSERPFGTPSSVMQGAQMNFHELSHAEFESQRIDQIKGLAEWSQQHFAAHEGNFRDRKEHGFIRECHGDMHLRNMILDDGSVTIFDCIEFNEGLRWIDVMNDVAFCVMDLDDRERPDLARRLLNTYLQHTGDYSGLSVLSFYLVYRALVRATVAWLRLKQERESGDVEAGLYDEVYAYLDLAERYTIPQTVFSRSPRDTVPTTCEELQYR